MYAADLPIATPISTVPVVITKPGHYYFVADLFFQFTLITSPQTAITVNAPGPVVIDMRGFILSGSDRYEFQPLHPSTTIYPTGILIQSSNVTVENGQVSGFWNGLTASGSTAAYLAGINLEGVEFVVLTAGAESKRRKRLGVEIRPGSSEREAFGPRSLWPRIIDEI
jgi:hypothetical protein